MPTIRDLVATIRQREGVEAAIVLGRDGLVIDGQLSEGLDGEDLSARIPAILAAAESVEASVQRGAMANIVLEYEFGVMLVSVLSGEALLLVLLSTGAHVGQLLLELRRNREHIAALV